MRIGRVGDGRGFSLLELIVALVIFQVGVLGVAGMVLMGQTLTSRAQLLLRGTMEAARVGDSLLSEGWTGAGEDARLWGSVRWEEGGEGSLRVLALDAGGTDTLAVLLLWAAPAQGGTSRDSLSSSGELQP